ncbi:MAG: hypothetical protein WC716_00455 [Chitinophagaceae bacterium]|jgi:hypothetical protein
MKNLALVLIILYSFGYSVKAQDSLSIKNKHVGYDDINLGLGFGLDKGGLGVNGIYYPRPNIGVLAGVGYIGMGYRDIGMGYCAGIKLRYLFCRSTPVFSPFLLGIYGRNSLISSTLYSGKDTSYHSEKVFNGFTFGLGFDLRIRPMKIGYFSIACTLPLESKKYNQHVANVRKMLPLAVRNYNDKQGQPLSFSLGIFLYSRIKKQVAISYPFLQCA